MKRLLLASAILFPALAAAQQISPNVAQTMLHPGYIVNNWYLPALYAGAAASPVANGSGTVVCTYGGVLQTITISTLGVRITTASAGGNLQLAVYADGSWGRPAALLANTASISTTSTGAVNAAASVQLPAGNYWFCVNADNATVAVNSISTGAISPNQTFVGSATQLNIINSSGNVTGISVAQTFNTWPTFASNTAWSEVNTNNAPILEFKVASVP